MIEIGDKVVSAELILKKFCCDLKRCKGQCCVEGNAGAPLEKDEIERLRKGYSAYKEYMSAEGRSVIERVGFYEKDIDGDIVTPLIEELDCAYSYTEKGVTKCAVERAFLEGRLDFRKPISCYLYPLREVHFSNGMTGLQYHEWDVCKGAEELGQKLGVPVYRMLKDPITERYGKEFFDALEQVEKELTE